MQEWWTPADLAAHALPGLPGSREEIARLADRAGWRKGPEYPSDANGLWRKRAGRGGGYEYRIDVLPLAARSALVMRTGKAAPSRDERAEAKATLSREERWRWFDGLPDTKKAQAKAKLEALQAVDALVIAGTERDLAMMLVAGQLKLTRRTLYNWASEVHGIERADWLPFLAPQHAGRQAEAECSPEAWECFKGLYLRQEQPTAAKCYRDLERIAKAQGWTIPSRKTLERRIAKLDRATTVYFRQGPEALKRLYPAQQRDRTALHALEAVNADGHKWDVWVKWPDGTVARPVMAAWQDLFSGLTLAWRVDRSETKEVVRLAFADVVETYGIPDHIVLDNGRAFASKWLTGGTETRYRFKVKEEDPSGLFPSLGCEVHWATPYAGQSKPIERMFRDFCQDIAKDVRLAGAWTGNTVANKPENYGSKAIPLETFLQVVAEGVAEHNARIGRRTGACGGKLSFEQAFRASYEVSPIRQATPEQARLFLLTSELVTARRPDGAVRLYGNRYWCEALVDALGRKVVARFDPDSLHAGIHIYRPDGAYLAFAPCVEAVGFFDTAAGRAHARARADFLRAMKAKAHAENRLSLDDLAAMLPQIAAPEPVEPKVVRPMFGTRGNAALKADHEHDQEAVLADFGRGLAKLIASRKENGAGE